MNSLKAYMDAGVLVAYGLGSADRHYPKAKHVIDEIVKGKIKGVVSLLSLLETRDVIRKRLVGWSKNVLDAKSNQQQKVYIQRESERRYSMLIDNLTKEAKANKMLIVDFDGVNIAEVLTICDDLLSKKFGDIRFFNRCWQCRRGYDHYEYKGIGPVDAMHFDLAKRVPCDLFVTTDRGFSGMDGQIAVSVI